MPSNSNRSGRSDRSGLIFKHERNYTCRWKWYKAVPDYKGDIEAVNADL
jgi:hypothetical protein